MRIIAKEIYGADDVEIPEEVQTRLDLFKKQVNRAWSSHLADFLGQTQAVNIKANKSNNKKKPVGMEG